MMTNNHGDRISGSPPVDIARRSDSLYQRKGRIATPTISEAFSGSVPFAESLPSVYRDLAGSENTTLIKILVPIYMLLV
ncbi:DEKNAAC101310 [Brettanomyces naardenensis]|uniref:DEKNAAC101310 n=1 Tax=Brettanomyces naardenensis TaxID=13370 RepID=A0A448YHS2_BRENA|nr:DEKNAAC101310 [Brettanomyces naardenensis]